jgi:hypothetical protein
MYGWPSGRIASPREADCFDRIVVVAQRGEPRGSDDSQGVDFNNRRTSPD